MILFLATLFLGLWAVRTQSNTQPELRVYTYSALASSWGAGPELIREFTQTCECRVTFVDVKEGGLILQRLMFERESSHADVILGLDQPHVREALKNFEFKTISSGTMGVSDSEIDSRISTWWLVSDRMMAFDWAPMTFITRGLQNLMSRLNSKGLGANGAVSTPTSLKEFLSSVNEPWALPNPRTSTVGLNFLLWLHAENPSEWEQILKGSQIKDVTPSWSQSYALFQKGNFAMALGFLSSLLFHHRVEKDRLYEGVPFKEYPVHIEYMAIPQYCKNCELAQKFVQFMISPKAQAILWQKNFMFPILSREFRHNDLNDLKEFSVISVEKWDKALSEQELVLQKWDSFAQGLQL